MINKYLKKRIVIITLLLVVFCIFNLFLSYSYYVARVVNNESNTTVSLQSLGVIITYQNNSGYINMDQLKPGSSVTKQFSISSNDTTYDTQHNTSKIWYNIRLVVEENTFSDNAIVCSLEVDSSSTQLGQTATEFTNKGIASGTNIEGMTLGAGYIVYGDVKHVYNLTFEYPVAEIYEVNKTIRTYVIVEVVDTANLNIDLDGGLFPSGASIDRVYGKNAIVVLETPTKEGYKHIGWEVTSGNASVNGNEITVVRGNISIKAIWENAIPEAKTFAEDDWETIAYHAQNPVDDRAPYEVGETKDVTLESSDSALNGKTFKLRIANNSNYDCSLESKTACGFVIEFQDMITTHRMNASATNIGGWPATEMRNYLNGTFEGDAASQNNNAIINALPQDLRAVIIDTEVISGHGSGDKNPERTDGNWTSIDKLYLLSTREVYGNCTGGTNNVNGCSDYASKNTITRQLDYYANLGVVTTSSTKYQEAIKRYNGSKSWWWLRSAGSHSNSYYSRVTNTGENTHSSANSAGAVAPAFRLG